MSRQLVSFLIGVAAAAAAFLLSLILASTLATVAEFSSEHPALEPGAILSASDLEARSNEAQAARDRAIESARLQRVTSIVNSQVRNNFLFVCPLVAIGLVAWGRHSRKVDIAISVAPICALLIVLLMLV